MPNTSRKSWLDQLDSIEDAVHSLRALDPSDEHFPSLVKVDIILWRDILDIMIPKSEKEGGNGSVDMPGM